MDVMIRTARIEDLTAIQELNLILSKKEVKDCTPTLNIF